MAEEFRRALLQTSNIVPSSDIEHQDYIICLQETGKMSQETGLVELQVRLPCEHVVGSGCIDIWLRTNNSCPMCRRVFFHAHQEQYLEDINVQNQEEDEEEDQEEEEEDREEQEEITRMLLRKCQIFSVQLRLDSATIRMAQMFLHNARCRDPFRNAIDTICDVNAVRLVREAIYHASSFTHHPRSPREICGVRDVDDHVIRDEHFVNGKDFRDVYRLIHGRVGIESDDHIENSRDLLAVRAHCVNECAHLQVPPLVVDLVQHIAANVIRAGFHAFSHPEGSEHLSESQITGVSIYIASHLLGQPFSRRSLQARIGNEYPDIRSTCIIVRNKCHPLVSDDFHGTRGSHVSWESLEADIGEENPDGRRENQEEEDVTRIDAPSTITRRHWLETLCDIYCARLGGISYRTCRLASRLSERFGSLTVVVWRALLRPVCTLHALAPTAITASRLSVKNRRSVTARCILRV